MTPEGKVKALVRAWLAERYPSAWVGMPVQMGYGRSNFLDFHASVPCPPPRAGKLLLGVPVAIETKAPSGKLTKRQKETIRDLIKAGTMTFVIRDAADIAHSQRQIDARVRTLCE